MQWGMALTSAERQRLYRARRAANEPIRQFKTVPIRTRRRTRPQRWADAAAALRALQEEYRAWREGMPDSMSDSKTAEHPLSDPDDPDGALASTTAG